MSNEMTIHCKDCKHFSRQYTKILFFKWYMPNDLAKCAHPSVASLVDGSAKSFCDIERIHGKCSRQAVNFEPLSGTDTIDTMKELGNVH